MTVEALVKEAAVDVAQCLEDITAPVNSQLPSHNGQVTGLSHDWVDWIDMEMTTLRELDENWDGYGAEAPLDSTMQQARAFLHHVGTQTVVPKKPTVMPSNDGGVMLEWETDAVYFIFEFLPNGRISAHAETSSVDFEGDIEHHIDDARSAWFQLITNS